MPISGQNFLSGGVSLSRRTIAVVNGPIHESILAPWTFIANNLSILVQVVQHIVVQHDLIRRVGADADTDESQGVCGKAGMSRNKVFISYARADGESYKYIIKPAAEAAGYECVRADEIKHGGNISVPMYEQLLNADVVDADVSTYNPNAFP